MFLCIFCLIPLLSNCVSISTPVKSIAGNWQLTTLDGYSADVVIRHLQLNDYYLHQADGHLNGTYQLTPPNRLTMIKAENPRTKGFDLRLDKDNELVVVTAPEVRFTQRRYMGTKLIRK